jgi:tripartite-type tricarboxylate transporter receptor subunit TctC
MLHQLARLAGALATALLAASAAAQQWPTKPVRVMVGASPGGGTDIIARLLAEKLAEAFKQPFVVENRPGASNTIAADITAKAPPDGTTLLVATNTAQAIAPHLLKLAYDPIKDLAPVMLIITVPNVIVMNPSVPANNVKELVALMKAKPDSFSFGSSGTGSTQHLAGEAFKLATGTIATHVPYKGSAQALADLVGGQIQLNFDTTSSAMSFIKGGKVKALAVTSGKRSAQMPDVATVAEQGVPGFAALAWWGFIAPAKTPPALVKSMHDQLSTAITNPAVREKLTQQGMDIAGGGPEEMDKFLRVEVARWAKVVRDNRIRAGD